MVGLIVSNSPINAKPSSGSWVAGGHRQAAVAKLHLDALAPAAFVGRRRDGLNAGLVGANDRSGRLRTRRASELVRNETGCSEQADQSDRKWTKLEGNRAQIPQHEAIQLLAHLRRSIGSCPKAPYFCPHDCPPDKML